MSREILLTIAIPTFNRSVELDLCLSQICKQVQENGNEIELLVFDNCSTDTTSDVVRKYIDEGFPIQYTKNEVNVGPDRNILKCFQKANGKYILIFGDDDVLFDNSLNKVMNVLKNGEYGVVFLKPNAFIKNTKPEKPEQTLKQSRTLVYEDVNDFIEAVDIYITFISGNVVNKSLIENKINLERFLDTNLNQLSWFFSALLNAKKNIVMNEYLVGHKIDNTGGYGIFKVFGTNLNKIVTAFAEEGLPRKSVEIINNVLLGIFFPLFIVKLRREQGAYLKENCFAVLRPIYKNYPLFWLYNVPLMILPVFWARVWLKFIRIMNDFKKMIRRLFFKSKGTELFLNIL